MENGLQYVVRENHVAPVAALRIYVKAGSIHEQEYLGYGISHLVEHLVSGGTTSTHTEAEINEIVDRLGGASNAYTTKDHTCYYITTTAAQIGEAIDLYADAMINCSFAQAEVDREIGVVLEELKKGREEPNRIISKALYETVFREHPVRYPVIGYETLFRKLTRDDVLTYYNRMYTPNNMLVVVTGAFDGAEVEERIKKAFSGFQRRHIPAVVHADEPRQLGTRHRTVYRDKLGGAYYRLAYRTIPLHHPDLHALDVLSYILSQGRSSRLIRSLKEEKRLVNSIHSYSYTPAYDGGIFGIVGTCADDNVADVITAVKAELATATNSPVSDDELAKAVKQKVAHDVLGQQTAVDEASDIGINVLTTGNPNFNAVYLDGIRRVTKADIQRVAAKYLTDDNLSVVLMRPESARAAATAAEKQLSAHPIRKVTLDNGLRVLIKRNPNVPLANIQLLFFGGIRLENGQWGISNITGEMLTRGTKTRDRNAIAQAFDSMGGRLSGSSGNNTFGINSEVLKEDLTTALDIIADVILNPAFADEEFATVQSNTLAAIERRNDSWSSEIYQLFRKEFFTKHPYGHTQLGEADTVAAMTAADVRAFYERHAQPTQGVMTIFGDIDPDEVEALVKKRFGGLRGAAAANVTAPAPEPAPTEDRKVTQPVKKQLSAVYVGYPGVSIRDHDDRYPMIVLDAVISGIGYPGGWLHHNLRGGDRDLVYLVHGYNFMGLEPGFFGITAASSPEKMDEVIAIILKDVAKIREQPVAEDELEKAKVICVTMEQLSRQTNSSIALQAAVNELYGLGHNHDQEYAERIQAVTAADVQRVAQKYLQHYVLVRTEPAKR